MSQDNIEKIGEIADTIDNLMHAMQLPMPPQFHLNQMKRELADLMQQLREIYTSESGENPWDESHLEDL